MNSPRLRIFLVTSHISLVYASLLARAIRHGEQTDVLLVDANKRRRSLIALFARSSGIYGWHLFHDFSIPAPDSLDYKPTLRQSVMRRIKNKPLIRNFYDLLRKRHLRKMDSDYRDRLTGILAPFNTTGQEVELFLLTQTYLNGPLRQLFPKARINYIEHGLPDYFNVLEPGLPKGDLYCVFAEGYKHYLEKREITTTWVKQLPGINSFSQIAREFVAQHLAELVDDASSGRPCVFVVLESVEMYNVRASFPVEYIDRVFAQLEDAPRYHYLLKPHPMQSQESILATTARLDELGYTYTLLDHHLTRNVSAEILFSVWGKNIRHVFCLFSAAGFYLSELYDGKNITFWYSTEFMSRHIAGAPLQFRESFLKARPLIEEVFAKKCRPY